MRLLTMRHHILFRFFLVVIYMLPMAFSAVVIFAINIYSSRAAGFAILGAAILFVYCIIKLALIFEDVSIKEEIATEEQSKKKLIYPKEYDMTIFHYLRHYYESNKNYDTDAKKLAKTMKNQDIALTKDCIYVKLSNAVFCAYIAFPEKNKHLTLYDEFSKVYPEYHDLKKGTSKQFRQLIEKYLKNKGYTFEYISPDDSRNFE